MPPLLRTLTFSILSYLDCSVFLLKFPFILMELFGTLCKFLFLLCGIGVLVRLPAYGEFGP
jgi:hypothetical protein